MNKVALFFVVLAASCLSLREWRTEDPDPSALRQVPGTSVSVVLPQDVVRTNTTNATRSDESCVDFGVAQESDSPQDVCNRIHERALEVTKLELSDGITLLVPLYKALRTMNNTVRSWQDSHMLRHPLLRAVVVRMNGCTCEDKRVVSAMWEPIRHPPYNVTVRILCGKSNWLFAKVMLALMLEIKTKLFFQTEADRPTLRRTNESAHDFRARVKSVIDVAAETASNISTPYVHVHRMVFSQRDAKMYEEWKQRGADPADKPIELTRPHQESRDVTPCWQTCEDRVDSYVAARADGGENGTKVQMQDAHCKSIIERSYARRCEAFTCNELILWKARDTTGMGVGSQNDPKHGVPMCYPTFVRRMAEIRPDLTDVNDHWFMKHRVKKYQADPFVACMDSAHFANAPAITNMVWYYHKVAVLMCHSKRRMTDAGFFFSKKKPYYNHYGKKMEAFMRKALMGQTVCHTDGITEHMELESYDWTWVNSTNN